MKRTISQRAMELSSKGRIKSLALLISIIAMKMMLRLGYILHPDYWGLGYVLEAAYLDWPRLSRIGSSQDWDDLLWLAMSKVKRVAEKLGFTSKLAFGDRKDAQGNRCDSLIYGLLKSEWGDVIFKIDKGTGSLLLYGEKFFLLLIIIEV